MSGANEGPSYELLLSCPKGLHRSQLFVDFSSLYDRVPHPDGKLEESINQIWETRVAVSPSLFNATKFRYGGYDIIAAKDDMMGSKSICLHLGLTDYKTFVGTNLSPEWEKFINPSTEDADRYKHTACPLGNGAIVETLDQHILVLERSHNVGEFPGHLVFPGGHSEPEEIGIFSPIKGDSLVHKEQLNAKIADEMFNGIIREVVEETGVPTSFLEEPLFLGVSRRIVNARPTAFFFIRCLLPSNELFKYYNIAEHGFESTKLLRIPKEGLKSAATNMPGCHQGGAALFDMMVDV